MSRKQIKMLIGTAIMALLTVCYSPASSGNRPQSSSSGCIDCHAAHRSNVPALYSKSTHAGAAVTCVSCHQGDATAPDRKAAHKGGFIGVPNASGAITMCASCHHREFESFQAGRHARDRLGNPRLDCTQCHGAHTVGARPASFNMAYFCSGCHGLEYLPETPRSLQDTLNQWDDIRIAVAGLREGGQSLPDSLEVRRKEIRRLIADIVHPTDLKNGLEKVPAIISKGDDLKKMIEREKKR